MFHNSCEILNTYSNHFHIIIFHLRSTGVTSPAAAGYLQAAAGYYTMPTTAAQLQQSAALYAAQPAVSQQSATATAAAAGANGGLQ